MSLVDAALKSLPVSNRGPLRALLDKIVSLSIGAGLAVGNAVTAAGNSQFTAKVLPGAINTVTTVPASSGVALPPSAAGSSVTVINLGANPLFVYGANGTADTINGLSGANGMFLNPGTAATFVSTAAGAWLTIPSTRPVSSYMTFSVADVNFVIPADHVTGGSTVDMLLVGGPFTAIRTGTLPLVTDLVAQMTAPAVGATYFLRITNGQAGAFAAVIAGNAGWTLNGSLSIAQNTWREYAVTLTSLTTASLQPLVSGTYP